jgi:hypothetical protein
MAPGHTPGAVLTHPFGCTRSDVTSSPPAPLSPVTCSVAPVHLLPQRSCRPRRAAPPPDAIWRLRSVVLPPRPWSERASTAGVPVFQGPSPPASVSLILRVAASAQTSPNLWYQICPPVFKRNLPVPLPGVRLRFVGADMPVMLSGAKHLGLEREIRTGYARPARYPDPSLTLRACPERSRRDDRVRGGDWQAWLTAPHEGQSHTPPARRIRKDLAALRPGDNAGLTPSAVTRRSIARSTLASSQKERGPCRCDTGPA